MSAVRTLHREFSKSPKLLHLYKRRNCTNPLFGTHSLRRTKATFIYCRTVNLRTVQLLLGHTKVERTARYLGVEVDDALDIAEQIDI